MEINVTKNELRNLVLSELNSVLKSEAQIQVQDIKSIDEKVNPEMKRIYQLLLKYGNSAKDAAAMIKKNLKYVNKTYRNSTPRGKAIALVGLSSLGEGTCGYGVNGKLGEEPAGPHLQKKKKLLKSKIDEFIEEACQKGYMTHPTRKTKIMFGKRYRNCVKKEGADTTMTEEQAIKIIDNICINCGDFTNENLRKWFKQKWVNIGKKKKGGGHPACGTSGKKRGYAKCVPAAKAARMTKKQKASATRRKRAAQNKANRGGKQSAGQGKKPIYVSTKPKK